MSKAIFIAGDWGTSSFRLALCDNAGAVLDTREGPGVSRLADTPAATFAALVADWDKAHGVLPSVLSGMVGSSIGWQVVPYLKCPARCDALAASGTWLTDAGRPILLLPGLSCRNPQDMPDVLRGEETQIAGALRLQPHLAQGRHLLCLPGTHSKWVRLEDGAVLQFQTALTGELFDLICRHSVLVGGAAPSRDAAGFAMGLAAAKTEGGLLHQLFAVRSRQLMGEVGKEQASAYLSGLMVGQDILGAKRLFAAEMEKPVTLIGVSALTALYADAFTAYGLTATMLDGEAASLAGLIEAYEAGYQNGH